MNAPSRSRTCNLLIRSQTLYPIALWVQKSGRRDSNPRPPPWQGDVLPLNYFRKSLLSYLVESLQQFLIILVLLVRVNIKK